MNCRNNRIIISRASASIIYNWEFSYLPGFSSHVIKNGRIFRTKLKILTNYFAFFLKWVVSPVMRKLSKLNQIASIFSEALYKYQLIYISTSFFFSRTSVLLCLNHLNIFLIVWFLMNLCVSSFSRSFCLIYFASSLVNFNFIQFDTKTWKTLAIVANYFLPCRNYGDGFDCVPAFS